MMSAVVEWLVTYRGGSWQTEKADGRVLLSGFTDPDDAHWTTEAALFGRWWRSLGRPEQEDLISKWAETHKARSK